MILRDKVLMAYWQLILFPVASSCTYKYFSIVPKWFYFQWLPPALGSMWYMHYKYYQSFSPLHHLNIRYFSIVQKSWVAKLRREGICIYSFCLEFFHYKLVLPLCCFMIEAPYHSKNTENIGANFPLLKQVSLHCLIWCWRFDISILQ